MLCIFDSAARPIETKKSAALKFSDADSLNFGATNYSAAYSPVSLSLLFLYVQQRSGHLRVCSSCSHCKGDVTVLQISALLIRLSCSFFIFLLFLQKSGYIRVCSSCSHSKGGHDCPADSSALDSLVLIRLSWRS